MDFSRNNKGNNKQQVNVNTRSIQLMNKEGFDPSTMALGFWNDMLSVKMHPALEPTKQTATSVYDYETTYQTVLTIEKAQLLLTKIKEIILPAIQENKDDSVGILIGEDSLIMVGTGVKQFGELKPFIGIFKGLNEKKKAESMICFEFKIIETIRNYDPTTGEHDIDKTSYPHLELFINFLEKGVEALIHANTHSIRHVDKYYRDKLMEAVGGSTPSFNQTNKPKTRDVFGNEAANTFNVEPEVDKENVEDINSFLN